mmetsp:Transcript_27381/g.58594  ORF Transcript_27381/g.58594 Transcript_27381/m.58594 type:complete len:110 (+) Transcript_27381:101-430(+)|eukprot:CAMPEP_0201125974 /NCGR_PEP_ID=MMETSP0850-20130426/24115_1 /ASSEMBLY_ACC=CAM_ASM_000622 /TAXON_ID=183588 /ORGANISM="Pseudo-nitzschia fraudulenta, Strain WWA7" /LENGTH=109 /DNA_ID=CAMNT_0047394211 /DNA_START=175 /DNA_END=504 /DNA_ORIENTATION=+
MAAFPSQKSRMLRLYMSVATAMLLGASLCDARLGKFRVERKVRRFGSLLERVRGQKQKFDQRRNRLTLDDVSDFGLSGLLDKDTDMSMSMSMPPLPHMSMSMSMPMPQF